LYVETEQIELKVKSASKRSNLGYEVSFSFQRYFIFASGVKIEQ